jgi:hypothetical protein
MAKAKRETTKLLLPGKSGAVRVAVEVTSPGHGMEAHSEMK